MSKVFSEYGNPDFMALLRKAGLVPTRQRLTLCQLIFTDRPTHFTAEALGERLAAMGSAIPLATVYNTLNHFQRVGLVQKVTVVPGRSYFDTNMTRHYHFYDLDKRMLTDIEGGTMGLSESPALPAGHEVAAIEITIRLRRE